MIPVGVSESPTGQLGPSERCWPQEVRGTRTFGGETPGRLWTWLIAGGVRLRPSLERAVPLPHRWIGTEEVQLPRIETSTTTPTRAEEFLRRRQEDEPSADVPVNVGGRRAGSRTFFSTRTQNKLSWFKHDKRWLGNRFNPPDRAAERRPGWKDTRRFKGKCLSL